MDLTEVFASKIYITYTASDSLSMIKEPDIVVVYEVENPRAPTPEIYNHKATQNENAVITVQQRVKTGGTGYGLVDTRPVGSPLRYIETKESFTVKTLYERVDKHAVRFLSRELLALATVDTPAYTLSISDKENRERKVVLNRTDTRRVTDFDETHVALEWESAFWKSHIKNDESKVCCVTRAEMIEPAV